MRRDSLVYNQMCSLPIIGLVAERLHGHDSAAADPWATVSEMLSPI